MVLPKKTVASVVTSLRQGSTSERDLAVAIHNYVRDIPFGFTRQHDKASADYTLSRQVGHCTPKAELFTNLLREAGLDATMVGVPIPGDVLRYLGPGESSPYPSRVHHTFTEVVVEGKTCRVDSYVTDPPLFKAAKEKLGSRTAGFGIHSHGTNEWDGKGNAFCQYVESTHTPDLEQKLASNKDLIAQKGYLHSDLMVMLAIPLVNYGVGSWLESLNSAIGALRK